MLDNIPNVQEMTALIGQSLYDIWNKLCALIDEKYDMECSWNKDVYKRQPLCRPKMYKNFLLYYFFTDICFCPKTENGAADCPFL